MSNELEKTGERVIASAYAASRQEYFIYQCHVATYEFAVPRITHKRVLEFGCGSGYGSMLLAPHCQSITALDISQAAIDFAQENYVHDRLSFQCIGDLVDQPLPFEDSHFDVVVSFQVVEHVSNDDMYFAELARVLRPGGVIIIATPDRTHRLFKWQKPWNQFHLFEYNMAQLQQKMSRQFTHIDGYYMSARADLVDMEISRTKKLRWLSLPFTLFFVPEFIRVGALKWLKKLTRKNAPQKAKVTPSYDFDSSDVYLRKEDTKSINLVVVASKAET